jgi:hypothetical protein
MVYRTATSNEVIIEVPVHLFCHIPRSSSRFDVALEVRSEMSMRTLTIACYARFPGTGAPNDQQRILHRENHAPVS